jgi:hypothetical protein
MLDLVNAQQPKSANGFGCTISFAFGWTGFFASDELPVGPSQQSLNRLQVFGVGEIGQSEP